MRIDLRGTLVSKKKQRCRSGREKDKQANKQEKQSVRHAALVRHEMKHKEAAAASARPRRFHP
jgi:hypothetical protein